MNSRLILLTAFALGCGNKGETTTAPTAAVSESSDSIPDDKVSQEFGERLMEANLSKFKPVEGDDVELAYSSFTFSPDGTWTANGAVEIMDESMECVEQGTWTMDPAESESTATMTWVLSKTNCAGRESSEQRVRLTLEKNGEYQVDFR